MSGQCTQTNPTLGSTPPQEGVEVEVVQPFILCPRPCIGSVGIPIFFASPTQEDFERDKDLETLLKSLHLRRMGQCF